MGHCHRPCSRFFVSFAALATLSTAGVLGFTASSTAFAAPPVAASKPTVAPEWMGELPTPPQQTAPWTPPAASGLPANLLEATRLLFDQGLADPRGCDYQTITVHVGTVWNGGGGGVETHGWVLPQEINGQKFAVCWNGLVYPVAAVKGRADLDADVNHLIKHLTAVRERKIDILLVSSWQNDSPEAHSLFADYPYNLSLLRAVLLLRLGENELAQKIADAWKLVTPPHMNGNDESLRDPYLYLASQWAWTAYERAVCAHMRGADALALADTNLLTRARPLIEVEADKRNYKTSMNGAVHEPGAPFLGFLHNLPDLQTDSARRVAEPFRPPIDWAAVKTKPQAERIAFLISRLEDVASRQSGQPGGVGLDDDPISQALITEGDAAVEPLFDAMQHDTRLTCSVSFPRDFSQVRNLLSVKDAAFACFVRITEISEIRGQDGKPRDVAALRAWWEKNKGASPADRWFAQLTDEGETVPAPTPAPANAPRDWKSEEQARQRLSDVAFENKRRWEEAAQRILERSDIRHRGMLETNTAHELGNLPPFKGEALRARQNPSVSDVLRKRALDVSVPAYGKWGFDYVAGANFALMLDEWDPSGAQTLPTLREVMRRCLDFQNKQGYGAGHSEQYQMSGRIARLALARVLLGDDVAANEYQVYLQSASPGYLGSEIDSAVYPLLKAPGNPAFRRVASVLFSPDAPTDWSKLLSDPKNPNNYFAERLFNSPMLRLPSFRDLVLRRLTDTTPAGTATQTRGATTNVRMDWNDVSNTRLVTAPKAKNGRQNLRIGDRAALALQYLAGVPPFDPVAPVETRDKACKQIADYLKTWGDALGGNTASDYYRPLYGYDMGSPFAYFGPTFPILDHSASEADVRANRAIFHLSGKKTRVAPDLPAHLPIEARWNNDPYGSPSVLKGGKKIQYSSGLIWQAEDEWNGKTWTRYYGYVGTHGLYKVPASEIELSDYRVYAAQKALASKPE